MRRSRKDEAVLDFLRVFQCATAEQMADLFWNGSLRYAQDRLLKMKKAGLLNRFLRPKPGYDEYVYTLGRSTQHANHHLDITQCYVDLCKLPGPLTFQPFPRYEFTFKGAPRRFTPDALVQIGKPGSGRLFWLECENKPLRHGAYDKISAYEAYLASGAYKAQNWSRRGEIYPAVVIVAEPRLLAVIQANIERKYSDVLWLYMVKGGSWSKTLGMPTKRLPTQLPKL